MIPNICSRIYYASVSTNSIRHVAQHSMLVRCTAQQVLLNVVLRVRQHNLVLEPVGANCGVHRRSYRLGAGANPGPRAYQAIRYQEASYAPPVRMSRPLLRRWFTPTDRTDATGVTKSNVPTMVCAGWTFMKLPLR